MIHRLFRSFAALAALALVAGATTAPPAVAADPYEIDGILSLTGPLSFIGSSEGLTLKILEPLINAEGGINGRPVHFNIVDDASQPSTAVQLANAIIAKHPVIMLGPTYGASCLAVAPLIKANNGPVEMCYAPTVHPAAGSYVFSGSASSRDAALATLIFAQAKGWKRVATIATTDAGGQDIEAMFASLLALPRFADMTVVEREHYGVTDVSVAAQLAKIKAAAPQALLAMTVGTPTGTVLRGLGDAGLGDLPVFSNNGNLLRGALAQYAPIMPTRMYFSAPRFYAHDVSPPGPVHDAQVAFYRAFAKAGIPDPDVGNNFSWDTTLILVAGLRKLGATADPKSMLEYMENVHGYAGTNGIYDYRDGSQRGQGLNSVVMVRWKPSEKRVVAVSEYGGVPLRSGGWDPK